MTTAFDHAIDLQLDLVLERVIAVPRASVWDAWTRPEHLQEWFTPSPWTTSGWEVDLRPGGRFNSIMHGPAGEEIANSGCILEVVPLQRFVFTDALLPGFRPAPKPFFTGIILLEDSGTGTNYTAIARHGDEETRKSHEAMGFHNGWGAALDQLVALMQSK